MTTTELLSFSSDLSVDNQHVNTCRRLLSNGVDTVTLCDIGMPTNNIFTAVAIERCAQEAFYTHLLDELSYKTIEENKINAHNRKHQKKFGSHFRDWVSYLVGTPLHPIN